MVACLANQSGRMVKSSFSNLDSLNFRLHWVICRCFTVFLTDKIVFAWFLCHKIMPYHLILNNFLCTQLHLYFWTGIRVSMVYVVLYEVFSRITSLRVVESLFSTLLVENCYVSPAFFSGNMLSNLNMGFCFVHLLASFLLSIVCEGLLYKFPVFLWLTLL